MAQEHDPQQQQPQSQPQPQKPQKSARFMRRQERIARVRGATVTQRVRVNPRDDQIRALLTHPSVGGFRSSGSVEWPLDQFTKRRLREGAVTLAEDQQHREGQAAGQESERRTAATRRTSAPPQT